MKNSLAWKKQYCSGCENNFYNTPGRALNGECCWSLEKAELVYKKKVPLDQTPPFEMKPIRVLSCYHKRGFVYISKDRRY